MREHGCPGQCSLAATSFATSFDTEPDRDILRIESHLYSGSNGPDGHVIPGSPQTIEWSSDGSVTASGWELCATPLPDGPGLKCLNTCAFAADGACDDGGFGATYCLLYTSDAADE